MIATSHWRLLLSLGAPLLAALLLLGCGSDEQPQATSADAAPAKQADAAQTAEPDESAGPAYDENGIPLPDARRQALGTAIPRGMKRQEKGRGAATYWGRIPPHKVFLFYEQYLDCSQVAERRKGWVFRGATPREPGDTSRTVDVRIVKRGRKNSTVVIVDRMGRSKVKLPDAAIPTFEDLHKAAHGGAGSVKQPIPGTY